MTFSLVGELPRHIYCFVDSAFTHKEPCGFIPAVWFGLVSYPGRTWGCTVMLESGAIYRNISAHAIAFTPQPARFEWQPSDAQTWDCYGERFTTLEYKYLAGLNCLAKTRNGEWLGKYLFTAAPVGDGFSAYPEQAKEFCFIQLHNGRLTIQPTNQVVFSEQSFTNDNLALPKGLKRQTEIYHAE
jgi:hypothetical protein